MATLIDRLVDLVTPPGAPLPEARYADGQGVYLEPLEGNLDLVGLIDADTPESGVTVGGGLRSVTTRYPGSSKVSTQIMGTEEDDIEINGWFRDVWTGSDGGAAKRFADLRALWLTQHYCQLSWGQMIVRRGYVKRVEATFTSERAIRYKIIFQVSEADEAQIIAKPFPATDTPFDLLALIREIADFVDDASVAAVSINNVARAVV